MPTNDPVHGVGVQAAATSTRINDLDALADANVSLSMNFAVDFPQETFKATFQQLVDYIKANVLNAQYKVGDIIIGTTTDTPASRGLTGTWEALGEGIGLAAVSTANANLGTIQGTNLPAVPVALHNHGASGLTFSGNAMANHGHSITDNGHSHSETYGTGTGKDATASGSFHGPSQTGSSTTGISINSASAGTPSGTISGSTANSGTDGVTIDVSGRNMQCVFWKKTADA